MYNLSQVEEILRQLKPELARRFLVKKIGIFGSFASEQQNNESDLDILVELERPIGWDFFRLEKFLEDQFGVKIDLVTPKAIKERLRDSILNNIRYI
jgi:predicted nucleotidyltransferase